MEDLCTIHPSVKSLMFRDIISLTVIFKISPLVGLFGVFRNCSLSIKQLCYITKILFLVLIPLYRCFGFTYVEVLGPTMF